MKIAIIDCIGLHYDGTTLQKRGIGGSESAIISIARELVKLGLEVTIFNDCNTEETNPGIYDGVTYQPIGSSVKDKFDIVISQRTVIPFTPIDQYDIVRQPPPRDYDPYWFTQFQSKDILKILWMQDTFIWGDLILEDLVVNGHIDEVFNLSDWHISYTTNCDHGKKRIFEVLKDKIFHTRNGINRWIEEIDISAKDPHHFVYNASITKGMIPLVKHIWPKVKQRVPQARLTIIGGYYDFKDNDKSPYKDQWLDLYQSAKNDTSITFTGIIPQPKIAEIVANASYMIYPGAYPETSGIATIESVNYNTPILGTRFGAMNESGTEAAGYYIDYAIEPNSLFPGIPLEEQVNKFVEMTVNAVNTPYLHQQKMYACNNIKDISTWDTIALQWKQHFYHKSNQRLSDDEQKRVDWINYRVHKVFERRYSNPEEVQTYTSPEQVQPLDQKQVKVAIIDIIGACYDGDTLHRRGLGGSEAAVVQIANELSHIGFDVTIFNACDEDDCFPGVYGNVTYLPLNEIQNAKDFDVVISSRVGTPFVPEYWNIEQTSVRKVPYQHFCNIKKAKIKVLWMHDTFSSNDIIIEKLLVEQHINELWTLSDFHYNYLTNNMHGSTYSQMRNYEVLRNHTWITRNGMKLPEKNRDLNRKQQYHFVFNSNRSKGLHPLLHDVWPQVKKRLPEAKLTVIGGYYKLGKAVNCDDEYQDFINMLGDSAKDESITFTGILPLEKIYDIYAKASYMIYPTEHPETFGISTLEAQYHNIQVITCKFGALEELAYPSDSMIEYSCTPNALKHDINRFEQAERLAELALKRVVQGDRKFHKAKFKQIREIAGWDNVALEWKQHIYSKLGFYLSASESQKAFYTKSQWQKIFGRRVTSPEQWVAPFSNDQRKIVVISPFYNADEFIERCIHSVAAQIYNNYEHILIDDCSTETSNTALNTIANLPENIRHKFKLIKNSTNQGAVYNHINTIRDLNDDDIVILLDGDDWLTNSPDIFQYYNRIHENNDFTYGSCWSVVDNIPLISQPYPSQVKANKSYREHMFNWYAPYTHLRTLKAKLIKYEDDSAFMDKDGNWFKAGGDLATFYQAIENCDSDRIYCSADAVYQYNDAHPHNDYKVNGEEQTKTARSIIRKPEIVKSKKKILIAIPCKNDIEADTFKSIYDLEVPEGYETEFQYFYGYAVDQVRNLIAHWVVNAYDYLLAIDHDVVFPSDTLKKMLAHDKPLVSGVYRQRLEPPMIELYDMNMQRMSISQLTGSLQTIGGCGFGCVLVKKEVFAAIQYPWFVYHQALTHNNTFSEDLDFCRKARDKGFNLYADSSILCKHIGQHVFEVEMDENQKPTKAYILRNEDNEISMEYSRTCAESCERIGLQYEFVNGPYYKTPDELWKDSNIIKDYQSTIQPPNASASESHFRIWKRIAENKETAIVLEHDALMLHPVNMNIPHGKLVNLGYKLYDYQRYNAKAAGLPTELIDIEHHYGSHTYAITYKTAEMLLNQLKQKGLQVAIDSMFFIRDDDRFKSDVPLAIMSPTPAICWLRQSTLNWNNGSMESNAEFIDSFKQNLISTEEINNQRILSEIGSYDLLPEAHKRYLYKMRSEGINPNVIYDIGACVLHWTNSAKNVWPNSKYVVFDAMPHVEFMYQKEKLAYVAGAVLYKEDNVTLEFYENIVLPGGNSIYKENSQYSDHAAHLFNEENKVKRTGMKLDTLIEMFNFPMPDLIKIDVQGAELDVLLGATEALKSCRDIILESQEVDYNIGAPKFNEIKLYLESIGFELVTAKFSDNGCDADYHFKKV